ncbi:Uncharacterised protein [Edwardsiella tarda]|nr:Uncharacterised protein [Edwardsiella tarda]
MDDINLLPWRECLRRHRQRTLVAMLSVWLLCQVGLGWGYGQLRGGYVRRYSRIWHSRRGKPHGLRSGSGSIR